MKGFIEVTLFRNCEPTNVLVSLGQIKYVEKDIGYSFYVSDD